MDFLFHPLEELDGTLAGAMDGAPLLVALAMALLLGLRHASDPDHLVAVTSLVAGEGGEARLALRLGAWWGAGHAATLVVLGVPLIVAKSELPPALELAAERTVGVVIVALAIRLLLKWARGDYRAGAHVHPPAAPHRHLRRGDAADHEHGRPAGLRRAFGIGVLHGLAGTGAVALLLVAALPTRASAAAALLVFALASAASMAACSTAFAWTLTRPLVAPAFRTVLIPSLGAFSLVFGAWYMGI